MIIIDKYVGFLIKYNITERQFLALYFVYTGRKDLNKEYIRYFTNNEKMLSKEDKEVLVNRELLTKDENGILVLSDEFFKNFIDKDISTDEIYKIYPTNTMINGKLVKLKTMDRRIFANLYQYNISGSLDEHREILEDIKYAKKAKILDISLEKFVKSKYWLTIREERLKL